MWVSEMVVMYPTILGDSTCNHRVGMGRNLLCLFLLKENPFASYFDIQQGYRVLTHTHVGDVVYGCMSPLKFPGLPGLQLHRGTRGVPTASGPSCGSPKFQRYPLSHPNTSGTTCFFHPLFFKQLHPLQSRDFQVPIGKSNPWAMQAGPDLKALIASHKQQVGGVTARKWLEDGVSPFIHGIRQRTSEPGLLTTNTKMTLQVKLKVKVPLHISNWCVEIQWSGGVQPTVPGFIGDYLKAINPYPFFEPKGDPKIIGTSNLCIFRRRQVTVRPTVHRDKRTCSLVSPLISCIFMSANEKHGWCLYSISVFFRHDRDYRYCRVNSPLFTGSRFLTAFS